MARGTGSGGRPLLRYSLLRLLCFLVPLAIVYALSSNLLLSAVVATGVGFALSVVLLNRRRDAASGVLAERFERRRAQTDEAVEDRAAGGGATAPDDTAGDDQADSAAASPRP